MKISRDLKERFFLSNIQHFAEFITDVNDREEINTVSAHMAERLLRKGIYGNLEETLDYDVQFLLESDEEKVVYESYLSLFDVSIAKAS